MGKQIISRYLIILVGVFFVVYFSGCRGGVNTNLQQPLNTDRPQILEEKTGETSLSGKVTQGADQSYFLQDLENITKTQAIESYTIDFAEYLDQVVTVKGKFSGNTFFVSEIE